MNLETQNGSQSFSEAYRWSSRILVLAIAGICLLTLYPFRLDPHRYPSLAASFLLPGEMKSPTPLDVFLNVLLFVPYGFGLAGLLRRRGFSPGLTLGLTLIAGTLASYSVEFTQSLLPDRDSNWEDVITNSTGSLVGCFLFQLFGTPLLRAVQRLEDLLQGFVNVTAASTILVLYFASWFAFSVHLQKATSLGEWDPASTLSVGGPTNSWMPVWKGRVYGLRFWDQVLPNDVAPGVTSSPIPSAQGTDATASYDLSGSAPFQEQHHQLPALDVTLRGPALASTMYPTGSGGNWLATKMPVVALIRGIQRSGRFSIYFRCSTAEVNKDVDASVVSISTPGGASDFEIRQRSSKLHIWFRTRVTDPPSVLGWSFPDAMVANQPRAFLVSYDGAKLHLYEDGRLSLISDALGPWTALAEMVRPSAKTQELGGYRYVFYGLIFFPAGCLIGLASRKVHPQLFVLVALLVFGILLPAGLLEFILVRAGNQPVSTSAIILGIFMSIAGWVWINLEGRVPDAVIESAVQIPTR